MTPGQTYPDLISESQKPWDMAGDVWRDVRVAQQVRRILNSEEDAVNVKRIGQHIFAAFELWKADPTNYVRVDVDNLPDTILNYHTCNKCQKSLITEIVSETCDPECHNTVKLYAAPTVRNEDLLDIQEAQWDLYEKDDRIAADYNTPPRKRRRLNFDEIPDHIRRNIDAEQLWFYNTVADYDQNPHDDEDDSDDGSPLY